MSRKSYERFFRKADSDGSGSLDLKELTAMLKKAGYKYSPDDVRKMFQSVDTSGDGKISLDEYMVAMGEQPEKDHGAAAMRRVFVEFDKNGDGTISRDELKQVFKELKQDLPDDQIARMIQLADKDQSGSLNYEEFISYVFGK